VFGGGEQTLGVSFLGYGPANISNFIREGFVKSSMSKMILVVRLLFLASYKKLIAFADLN